MVAKSVYFLENESVSRSVMSHSLQTLDYNSPGSSVHGISHARILEWVAISFSRRYSWLRDGTLISHVAGSTSESPGKSLYFFILVQNLRQGTCSYKLVIFFLPTNLEGEMINKLRCRWNHFKSRKWRGTESLLMKVKEGWKSWLKTQYSKHKDHGIWSYHFMGNKWGKSGNGGRFHFLSSKMNADGDCSHKIKRSLLLGRIPMTTIDSVLKKQRHHFANKSLYSQSYGFSSSHVWMWELDNKEGWVPKNWCFWTVVLEKTLESPLEIKEIKPVNP